MTNTAEWEKEFDEEFYHEENIDHQPCEFLVDNKGGECDCQLKDIKAFIRSLLAQQRQELLNLVEILIDEQEWISTGGDFLKFVAKGIAPQEELRQKLSALRLSIKKKV